VNAAICIGCGCDDDHACELGCAWLNVDRSAGLGVCSSCPGWLGEFKNMRQRRYFVSITYKIICFGGPKEVEGRALWLPAPFSGLRFCVSSRDGEWRIDHYDSGRAVNGPTIEATAAKPNEIRHARAWARDGSSRERAVRWLIRWLRYCRKQQQAPAGIRGDGLCLVSGGGGAVSDKSTIEWTDALRRRFWFYVQKSSGCWLWTAGTFGGRYGQFRAGKQKVRAHRAAWLLAGKTIPAGLILCHRCDNAKCVRTSHLFLGTDADNARDRDLKGRTSKRPTTRLPGELNPAARLTEQQVAEIRRRNVGGESQRTLAAAFNISQSQVGNIVRGKSWR
jgi:hypothetical protein